MDSPQAPTPYDRLGGAVAVRKLVTRFYDLMSELPEAREVLAMHPTNLASSREKLFEFLSGWLGGPQLYVLRRGHPRMRARHLPFRIDRAARDAWMRCMRQALEECAVEAGGSAREQNEIVVLREQLLSSFHRLADHMRNVEEPEQA